MKLSSLIMIFAAVDARKVETGSRYAKKLGFLEAKKEKKEEKAAAKEFQAMQRSLSISSGGRPKGERRQIRKDSILNRQAGRQGRRDNRVANSSQPAAYGSRVEGRMDRIMMKKDELKDARFERKQAKSDARKDAINAKQANRAENNQEAKAQVQAKQAARQEKQENRQENKKANKDAVKAKQAARQDKQDNRFSGIMQRRMVINQKQDARAERGPKETGQRREARKEKQDEVKEANKAARASRQLAIQLKKTWNPCENGTVSNESLGPRKKGHMQKCMMAKEYQNDALRCIVYGMRAEHVDKACANICDQILASYGNLNQDMAACELSKKN
jgi:hypothetical protein